MIVSLAGVAGSYLWLGQAGSYGELVLVRALAGAMSGNLSVAQAYIADITTPENRARGMGMFGAAFALGFIFGPVIGGTLAGPDPAAPAFMTPFLIAAGLAGLALVLTVILLKESLPADRRGGQALTRGPGRVRGLMRGLGREGLGLLIVLTFVVTLVFAGMEVTFALWAERAFDWGPQPVGYVFAFAGFIAALVQGGLIGRLSKRFGEARLVLAGAVILGLGMLLLPFSAGLALVLVAMALLAVGLGLLNPSLQSLISRSVDETIQGATLGVSQSASSLARIVAPMLAGTSFEMLGRNSPYFAGALIMVGVVLAALSLQRRWRTA